MRMRCVVVKSTLSVRGEPGITSSMSSHVGGCFACRSELSTHRRLHTTLSDLKGVEMIAPSQVLPNVMAETVPWVVPDLPDRFSRRVPVAAAAALATAAAGSAVLFRLYRQRTA